jgi:tRNA nucleotidyltransferase (CCA-adding enzyme)
MTRKTYLVGGAVRDRLLGMTPRERDWVIVGGTPEELESLGYRRVGASFPVFLHPDTGEEYALARTERKQGHGYHGFTVDFDPGVTLEEDLQRRDLTINAMALSGEGELIDPYGGATDLENRVLRHVSPAFREDPLRVLRVARFAARLAGHGFRVHEDTLELMRSMTASGELEYLAPERTWAEIADAMATSRPSRFVDVLRDCGALAVLLPEVDRLFGVPQTPAYHPEIDTGEHIRLAMDFAAAEAWGPQVVFALLLHDLGKGLTEKQFLPAHYGHEKKGVPLVEAVCERLRAPNSWRDLAVKVCALHLRTHRLLEARPETVMDLIEEADLLRRPEVLPDYCRACEADYRGRKGLQDRPYPQAHRLQAALQAALSIRARDLDTAGLSGPQVGEALRAARVRAIAAIADPAD